MKKILSPKLDVVFHMLFGEQKHERITKKLIGDVIGERVETIELDQTPYLWGEQAEDKVGIIDVRATINNKNPIDIEMQIVDNKNIEKRILFYWSKLYLKQLKVGENYNKLNRSIAIIFLDYEIEKLKELPMHTKWQIKESKNGKYILTEDLEIHIIELTKIKGEVEEGSLKKWILFLENPEGEETRKMAEKEEEIKEAIEALEDISSDEEKIRIAELREKYIMDRESELETAEEKGKKGIAKKLKAIGISKEEIAEITGLTVEDIEELNDISNEEEKIRIVELREKYIMDRESELETAEEKGKKGIAKKLKAIGISKEEIAEITGLTVEDIEELKDISNEEEKIRIAELREKYIMDRESELETAEEKGKKGIAKKLKAIGISKEEIAEITGLTVEDIEELKDISNEEEKIRIAELREKYIMDRESELETAEEKGKEQGNIDKSREIAQKLKSKNMRIEEIAEITGLTKEEVEKL